jgi:DUF1009 family protein
MKAAEKEPRTFRRYGMIAGNGRFPLLALEAARRAGDEVVCIGILVGPTGG